ncbi:response regulator [Lacimicrobium sp. SS2-24]|uniref:response regulator n=1 Tax=Lacimicrobium sp. SS2-24 TaxID=2005569 RepID=UPI000B4A5EB3|nr:response regulator [Lacimicrobium sp. SS2-24]
MDTNKINIAVVEDNGVARINLRNHLLEMGFSDIGCYSHGRELKPALKQRHFHLLLMDFHLGLYKNGVEVINELQKEGLLKPSTCIVFVTSDRVPMIVGQIMDVHPDALVLKPYTIRNLEKTLLSCMRFHHVMKPVLDCMDKGDYENSLARLEELMAHNKEPKYRTNMIKLKARILLKLQRYKESAAIYEEVLKTSDKIIWAKWGLIQSTHLMGETQRSEKMLEAMLDTHLTSDKACEWLARINIDKEDYDNAQRYLDRIKDGELSLSAARLKAYLYETQDQMDEAIRLLEKKRESNRNIRERFTELSLDLARCYLNKARDTPMNERGKHLQVARFLIGGAGRNMQGNDIEIKRNYMTALAAVLEDDKVKARELLSQEGLQDTSFMDIPTLSDAVSTWHDLGEKGKASELLHELEVKLTQLPDENERTVSSLMMRKNEQVMGDKKSRALEFNKKGLEYYVKDNFNDAIDLFYQAYILFPSEPAFSLNLLQSMVEAKKLVHKKASIASVKEELTSQSLSTANAKRYAGIAQKIDKDQLDKLAIDELNNAQPEG